MGAVVYTFSESNINIFLPFLEHLLCFFGGEGPKILLHVDAGEGFNDFMELEAKCLALVFVDGDGHFPHEGLS